MENRPHGATFFKTQMVPTIAIPTITETHVPPGHPVPNSGPRPLSDIRELSEPSVTISQRPGNTLHHRLSASRANSLREKGSMNRTTSARIAHNAPSQAHMQPQPANNGSSSYSSTPEDRSSFYSIPHSIVPRRSSSQTHAQRPARAHVRKASIRAAPPPPHPDFKGFTVPNRGQSQSPVKEARQRLDAVKSDAERRVPSKTYIRTPCPTDILEFPSYRHPRIKLELQVSAPLFVGGGSVEGQVKVTVDENDRVRTRRSLGLGAISVDLLGFEDIPGGRKATFLSVGTDLIDAGHPPPTNMAEPPNPLAPGEKFWMLTPCTSALPFMVSLPLDTGPPPFQSKNANIRFLLCTTAIIRDAGKLYRVRTSQDVHVIATYDPEKALTSLPSPLTATDELTIRRLGRCETVKLTAGLHRQVWVSGSSIFADVHIANKSHKAVKRLELSLERDILCYKHGPAATREKSASQARIFESNEQTMITRTSMKTGLQGWNGVEPHSSDIRTCELELPRGHATVRCGKFFEVRFFLNVTASLSNTKLVSVQLPITLIHMNSLDVLPNSVAQVTAAIEEKRAQKQHQREKSRLQGNVHGRQRSASSPAAMADLRRRPSYSQGRAFAAPRQQSIDLQRAAKREIDNLQQTLDSSPRKYGPPKMYGAAIKKMDSNISIGAVSLYGSAGGNPFANLAFQTPSPMKQKEPTFESENDRKAQGLRYQLSRMQSLDSMRSKKSFATIRSRRREPEQFDVGKPKYNFTVVQNPPNRIQPHTLGLSTTVHQGSGFDGVVDAEPISRPSTGLSFRDRMDKSRFEIKGVRRKASGSVKDRGMKLWGQVRDRTKEKEGWI
ncbi:hypothetical protein LTR37_001835 [Vermiconidia calcicola]|uniref:Uncharacterized protein n=1 Tax=Vermiconidia calcicola TaxID=1690605 RepID=A0ACC3NXR2_9PEZI|nr:hypothetical protein LTR37_001835 [Vermiconidia calcicola]